MPAKAAIPYLGLTDTNVTTADVMQPKLIPYACTTMYAQLLLGLRPKPAGGVSKTNGVSPVHVQANADVVRGAMKSPQASVRQCAMRVFKLLGGDTLPQPSHAPASASAVAAPDLMGNLLGEEETPAAAPQDFLGEYRPI